MTIPTYLPYFIAAGTVAVLIAIFYGLNRALADAHWPAADRTRTLRVSAVILLGWLAAAITLSAMGIYHVTSGDRPTIQYGILLPILIGALMIWRSEATKRVLHAVPQQWLVGVQLFRALGAIFLILSATGTLPRLFALPAGLGDTVVGLLAPVVGLAYARAPHKAAGLVAAWNVLGLLDLIDALGLGFLTAPSRYALEVQPTSDLMTVLPLVLVPVYLVPLFFVLHLASLAKLRREAVASRARPRCRRPGIGLQKPQLRLQGVEVRSDVTVKWSGNLAKTSSFRWRDSILRFGSAKRDLVQKLRGLACHPGGTRRSEAFHHFALPQPSS